MLWRVRTALPDRPGALALLAEQCGAAEINILGVQIFPGIEAVTDELVLQTPADWGPVQITRLVESAGGRSVAATPCSEAALADQPTRYVQAARAMLDRPTSFPRVMARLFDAESEVPPDAGDEMDVMELSVGEVQVQIRRRAAFTATEHTRGSAMAALVNDVLRRRTPTTERPASSSTAPAYVVAGDSVSAVVDGAVVGLATVHEPAEDGVRALTLRVENDWRRRGIGTRLLLDAGRLAHEQGADEIVLTTRSDNPAVLPMVLAAGLRGRIRMAGEELTVRVPVRDLRPLRA
jgi:ribosomal protein S18 acetylase RimI-like enzyme